MEKKGFTLIEILVVISIIGILSSIVLASLAAAKDKGNDARVKSQMNSVRSAAEIYYYNHGNRYNQSDSSPITQCDQGMFLDATSGLLRLMDPNNYPPSANLNCNAKAGGDAYAVQARLSSSGGGSIYWCIDSKGASKQVTSPLGGASVCPAS